MVRRQGFDAIEAYGAVPISFEVSSRLDCDALRAGRFIEIPVDPWLKDYDAFPDERPAALPTRFDVTNWEIFAAFRKETRVGGAILAWNCPGFDMLEGRTDLAVLADIRVVREARGSGVGRALLKAVEARANRLGCRELKVETQDINVAACRFYRAVGFSLTEVNEGAYGPAVDEVQLIWRKALLS